MTSIFGQDFAPSKPVFILMVCAYGSIGPGALFTAWLMGRDRPWTILAMNVLWVITLLAIFQLGFSGLGATGAAIASVVAYSSTLIGYVFVLGPRHALPWSGHLPMIVVTVAALGCGAALQLVPNVPLAVAVGGNLLMAAIVFWRWGAPSVRSSGLLRRWLR